jgi:hypothetical protein
MVDLRLPIESQLGPVVAKTPQGPESGPRNNVTEPSDAIHFKHVLNFGERQV